MFALVDAVAFYASAEKVFDPSLRKKPVVVLTNNDGCICAVCPIARQLNIPKFLPYFQIKDYLAQHQVVVRSSNYELYADLSERMMNVIAEFGDDHHVYSIDEAFLQFSGYQYCIKDWMEYGQRIRQRVWRETKLPVGVGFGSTATLAKAANHAAKKLSGFTGVAIINTEPSRKAILTRMAVTDVWGIGRRLGKRLNLIGIDNAWQLAQQPSKRMRQQFGVVMERVVAELNGEACLEWDEVPQIKKEIFSTRSFGERINDYQALRSALMNHGATVARKLRKQRSLAKQLLIFASSSAHQEPYYKKSLVHQFTVATANTQTFAEAIERALTVIYQPNVQFYKCGIGAIELMSGQFYQGDLFNQHDENEPLMRCIDGINQRFGQDTLCSASQQMRTNWHMKRAFLSPHYTTRWQDVPKIQC